jgi:hypothetical protein
MLRERGNTEEETKMLNKHRKHMSASLIIRKWERSTVPVSIFLLNIQKSKMIK